MLAVADTWNSYFLFGVEPAPPTFDTGHWYLELMGRKLRQGVDDLASVFPSFASEWHESKNGWDVVASFESQSGRAILETETSILGWIRRVHKLPAYLSNQDMGKMAGWSETFSAEGPSDREIADEIQNKLSEFSASEVLAKDVK